MTMPYTIQDVRNIILRPHAGQFVIDELPLIFMCMAGLVYGGMEGMPLGGMATVIALFLFLVLLYRFICLRRICYRGLSGTPEPPATALRSENGRYPFDGPEQPEARPYRYPARKRHRGDYP